MKRQLMKIIFRFAAVVFVLVLVFTFIGCVTPNSKTLLSDIQIKAIQSLWNLDDYPMNVYLGISAPYVDTNKMVSEALYQCARSIAISHRIQVESSLVSESSAQAGMLSFATEGSAVYFENEIKEILERLELREVRGDSGVGIVVIATDPSVPALPRPFTETYDLTGRPSWVDQLPKIPGYLTAVGETLGYRFVRDSLEAADVLAAEQLLRLSSEAVTQARSYSTSSTLNTGSGSQESFQEGVLQISEGTLQGFYVLARWYDSASNRYYSLAVVPH